jgi:hypothetical protein
VAIFRKTVLATALIGSGLVSTTGMAMAHEHHDAGQRGVFNVDDVQTIVPVNACNNNVPVNVGGIQVPIQDVAGNVPILSPVKHGQNAAGIDKSCSNGVKAHN